MTTINYNMALHPWSVWGREVHAPRGVEYICQQSGLWQHRKPIRYRYPGLPESVPEEHRLLLPKKYAEKRMEEVKRESYSWDLPKTPAGEAELRRKVTPRAAPPKPPGKAKGYVRSTFVKHDEFVLELRQNTANWSVYLYIDEDAGKDTVDRVLWAKATGLKAADASSIFSKARNAIRVVPAEKPSIPDTSVYVGEKGRTRMYKGCIVEEVPVSKRKKEYKVYLSDTDAKTGKVYKYVQDMDTAMSVINDYIGSTSKGITLEQARIAMAGSPSSVPESVIEEYEGCIITRKNLFLRDKKTGQQKPIEMFPVYTSKYMYEAGDSKWLEPSLESARRKAREGTR